MTRDNAPDLLASMFGERQEEEKPAQAAKEQPPFAQKQPPTPVEKPPPAPAEPVPAAEEPVEEPPIRCTHYLSRETAGRLPIAQGTLLMMTALQKRDVSNSAVVEAALRMAFADLEANGESSRLIAILREMAREE